MKMTLWGFGITITTTLRAKRSPTLKKAHPGANTMYRTHKNRKTLAGSLVTCGAMCLLASTCWAGQPSPSFSYDRTAALSEDGTLLAVVQGDNDNDIGLIDTATGRTLRVLKGCGCTVSSVVLSPDDKLLATYATVCSGDTDHWEAKLWDVQTGKLRQTLEVPDIGPHVNGPAAALGFAADGLLAATTEDDPFVRLWDTRTGKRQRLASRQQFFFTSDGDAVPMTAALSSVLATFSPHTPLEFTTFSRDKHLLLTIRGFSVVNGLVTAADGPGKAALLWDAERDKQLRSYPLEGHTAYSGSIRDGKVIVGGEDYARVWSLSGGPAAELWHEASSADKFDWFGHSYVELVRLTQNGNQANMIAVRLKPFVNKDPRDKFPPWWFTEEARLVRVDAATGNKTTAFVLTGR